MLGLEIRIFSRSKGCKKSLSKKSTWIYVGIHGNPHGKVWIPIGTYRNPHRNIWIPMGIHLGTCGYMDSYVRNSYRKHGFLWECLFMLIKKISWGTLKYLKRPWNILKSLKYLKVSLDILRGHGTFSVENLNKFNRSDKLMKKFFLTGIFPTYIFFICDPFIYYIKCKCTCVYIFIMFVLNFCIKLPLHVMEVFFSNVY